MPSGGLAFAMNTAPMRLLVPALLGLLCAVRVVHADSMLPDGSTIVFNRLFIHENNSKDPVQPAKDPDSLYAYFNWAHCVCAQPNAAMKDPYYETTFAYELLLQNVTTPLHQPAEIWVGTSCDDPIMRPTNCHKVPASIDDIASLQTTNGAAPEVSLYDLMNPEPDPMYCPARVLNAAEWVIADTTAQGSPNFFVSKAITTDSLPPPLPTQFTAEGAENAIQISWTAPVGDVADIAYFQALCATDGGSPGRTDPPAARYITPRNLCGAALDPALSPSDIATSSRMPAGPAGMDAAIDAPVDAPIDAPDDADLTDAADEVSLVQGLAQLDPAYICGESADATATSLRLENLKNGVPYTVVLLAIDKYGNAAGTYFTSKLTPHPVTDFWEDLHGKGSKVEGGFCLIADTYGDGNPLTTALRSFRDDTLADSAMGRWLTRAYYATLAPLGAYVEGHLVLRILAGILLLPLVVDRAAVARAHPARPGVAVRARRVPPPPAAQPLAPRRPDRGRRRARAGAAGTGARPRPVAVLGGPDHGHGHRCRVHVRARHRQVARRPAHRAVHAADRFAGHDEQQRRSGPVRGDVRWLLDPADARCRPLPVHRLRPARRRDLDRLLGKTAHAFVDGSDPNDPNRPRSPGDTTTFRLIPMQLTAVYRFSYLDDEYGIPVVPYVRGGLGYYAWWSTAPNGNFSRDADGSEQPLARGERSAWSARSGSRSAPSASTPTRHCRCTRVASSTPASTARSTPAGSTASARAPSSTSATRPGSPASTSSSDVARCEALPASFGTPAGMPVQRRCVIAVSSHDDPRAPRLRRPRRARRRVRRVSSRHDRAHPAGRTRHRAARRGRDDERRAAGTPRRAGAREGDQGPHRRGHHRVPAR